MLCYFNYQVFLNIIDAGICYKQGIQDLREISCLKLYVYNRSNNLYNFTNSRITHLKWPPLSD